MAARGRQALGPRAAARVHGAADDEPLPAPPACVQRLARGAGTRGRLAGRDRPRAAGGLHARGAHQPPGGGHPAGPSRDAAGLPGGAARGRPRRAGARRRDPRRRDPEGRRAAAEGARAARVRPVRRPREPCVACLRAAPHGGAGARVHRPAGEQHRHASARRASDRVRRPPLPALPQRQAAPRGGDPDRAGADRTAAPPGGAPERDLRRRGHRLFCCPHRPPSARSAASAAATTSPAR